MGANPKLRVLRKTFSRKHKVHKKYTTKTVGIINNVASLFFAYSKQKYLQNLRHFSASNVRNGSLNLGLVFGKPFQIRFFDVI
jgi:hypothetical protein